MHALPYKRITEMLQYKLTLLGIRLITVCEAYSSQCSPLSLAVSKRYAQPDNRKSRGVYIDSNQIWNADAVGAYNILRLYLKKDNPALYFSPKGLSDPKIIKVAV